MRMLFAILLTIAFCNPVLRADELDDLDALSQAQFRLLAEDLGAVLAYKGMQPAEPYGVIGFDVGLEASAVRLSNDASWEIAGADVSTVPLTRLSATKGLPLGFDIGGFIATAPGTGMRVYGAQLRYAFIEGGIVAPAVGLRAATTRLEGVDALDYGTTSLDLSISKGFGPLTPYAGYGRVWASASPDAATGLVEEDVNQTRAFAGLRLSFLLLEFTFEAERTGETSGYSAKLGFSF